MAASFPSMHCVPGSILHTPKEMILELVKSELYFVLFKTGSLSIALDFGCPETHYVDQTSNSQRSTCFCFPRAGIKGVHHNAHF